MKYFPWKKAFRDCVNKYVTVIFSDHNTSDVKGKDFILKAHGELTNIDRKWVTLKICSMPYENEPESKTPNEDYFNILKSQVFKIQRMEVRKTYKKA